MVTANKAQQIVNNRHLLEKVSAKIGKKVMSFDDWKSIGKWVKKGQKQQSWRVKSGSRITQDPITGNDVAYPVYATAYGFTEDQVN